MVFPVINMIPPHLEKLDPFYAQTWHVNRERQKRALKDKARKDKQKQAKQSRKAQR